MMTKVLSSLFPPGSEVMMPIISCLIWCGLAASIVVSFIRAGLNTSDTPLDISDHSLAFGVCIILFGLAIGLFVVTRRSSRQCFTVEILTFSAWFGFIAAVILSWVQGDGISFNIPDFSLFFAACVIWFGMVGGLVTFITHPEGPLSSPSTLSSTIEIEVVAHKTKTSWNRYLVRSYRLLKSNRRSPIMPKKQHQKRASIMNDGCIVA